MIAMSSLSPCAVATEKQPVLVSIVTPAFNEEKNLPLLYDLLVESLAKLGVAWEWVVVDDHSRDNTFDVVKALALRDGRVRGVRFARNCGSHTALYCGLTHTRGDCAIVLAADLQDPPEVIGRLLENWHGGAQVVWAARAAREGEKRSKVAFANWYYWIMRKVVGLQEIPDTGADFFLADRRVIEALRLFPETNVSILALICYMGFRQSTVTYNKRARQHGQSGWTLRKKLKLVVDSVTSFSFLPIRILSGVGMAAALVGFLYALVVVVNAVAGNPAEGWSSLMVVILVMGGLQMLMMGVLGEYLWRVLAESRRRPRYLIENSTSTFAAGEAPVVEAYSKHVAPPGQVRDSHDTLELS
jgi:dolichol-phosphate mannosyltransferase